MTWEKEGNLVKLFFPAPTPRLAAGLSLGVLLVFVKMGTCEEMGEGSVPGSKEKGLFHKGEKIFWSSPLNLQ